jgi:hypothetical protein
MSGASDKARFYLEQAVPQLQEFEQKRIFSKVCAHFIQPLLVIFLLARFAQSLVVDAKAHRMRFEPLLRSARILSTRSLPGVQNRLILRDTLPGRYLWNCCDRNAASDYA